RRTGNSFGRSPQASANLSDGDRRRVDLYARPHGRGNRHALDVVALGANRLRLDDSVCESLDVFFQSLGVEGSLADAGMDDTSLLDAEFDGAALGGLDRTGDIHGDRADLRVRHHATRAEHLAETTDQRHHVGSGDAAIEIDLATLDDLDQVFRTDDVRAGFLGFVSLGATSEDGNANVAAG